VSIVDKAPGAVFEVGSIQLPAHEFSNPRCSAGFAGGIRSPSHARGYSRAATSRPGPPQWRRPDCGCGRHGWPASVSRDHGILRLGAEVKAGYGLNVAPDPGSAYARKLMGCAAGPEFFDARILRARSCRQQKGRSLRQILILRFRTAGRRPGLAVKCRAPALPQAFYESGRCRLPGLVQR